MILPLPRGECPHPPPVGRQVLNRRSILAAPALVAACTRPAAACTRIADLPLRLVDGYPLVAGSILGQPVSFLLDTGAQGMLITPETAERLHLPLRGMTRIFGTGGSQDAKLVLLPGLRLGDAAMPAMTAPVAPLPVDLPADPPLAGLLGAALLARFDLDLDVPRGRLGLALPDGCPPPPGATIALDVSRAGEAYAAVRVNGEPMLALLDTGSRATLLTQAAARRLGLGAPVSANTARGVDGERMPLEHVRVRLALGDDPAAPTPVSIAPLQLNRGDMLLGLDILGRRRIWIGYARGEARLGPFAT